ncbi:MAG TPA: PIN domain-containing protein [Candidatus Sulfomarinibacteraceae bacterium]|nr:PIN domain-containing protein [Candidatus Sulfomarinibacteraceae bacterium]
MSVPTIVDTSVWIDVLRDGSGRRRQELERVVDPDDVLLTPFTELELLQGCRDESEWSLLASYLETQEYVEPARSTWASAARIFFDLRRTGRTVRSPVDCCIAQVAIDGKTLLLHRDRDFEVIAEIRPLQQRFLKWRE